MAAASFAVIADTDALATAWRREPRFRDTMRSTRSKDAGTGGIPLDACAVCADR